MLTRNQRRFIMLGDTILSTEELEVMTIGSLASYMNKISERKKLLSDGSEEKEKLEKTYKDAAKIVKRKADV